MTPIYLAHFVLNLIILIFFSRISNQINLFDTPDKVRKFHDQKIACIGGVIVLSNMLMFVFLDFFYNNSPFDYKFIIIGFLFFLIGFIDDKYNIDSKLKVLFFSIIIFFLLLIDKNIVLDELRFSFNIFKIDNDLISIFFTILCLFLFINAFNMLDGMAEETRQREAEEQGVFGVPSFLFEDGELYWGREHLTRIREILEHKN